LLDFQCSFGQMDSLLLFAMANNSTNECSDSGNFEKTPLVGVTDVEDQCNLTNNTKIQSYFNENCKDTKDCYLPFNYTFFPEECQQENYD
jgi:hypothetical protein